MSEQNAWRCALVVSKSPNIDVVDSSCMVCGLNPDHYSRGLGLVTKMASQKSVPSNIRVLGWCRCAVVVLMLHIPKN